MLRWLLRLAFGVIAMIAAAVVALAVMDLRAFAPRIEQAATAALELPVTVAGPVEAGLWPAPWLSLGDVSVGQAAGFGPAPLVRAASVRLSVALAPLWAGRVEITEAAAEAVDVALARDGQGRGNWERAPHAAAEGVGWRPTSVALREGRLALSRLSFAARPDATVETLRDVALTAAFDTASDGPSGKITLATDAATLAGRDFAAVTASAVHQGDGGWRLTVDAVARHPSRDTPVAAALDLDQPLRALDGAPLVFALTASVGGRSSRAAGTLRLDLAAAPPAIDAQIDFGALDLSALAPRTVSDARDGRVIPAASLPAFTPPDLRVTAALSAERLTLPGGRVLTAPQGRLSLRDGVLALDDVSAGLESGRIAGGGRFEPAARPQLASLRLEGDGLAAGAFLGAVGAVGAFDPSGATVGLSLDLSGRGGDLRALVASLDGRVEGRLSGGRLRLVGGATAIRGLGVLLDPMLGRDSAAIRCGLMRWRLDGGVATSLGILLDSPALTVSGRGTVSLRNEALDLVMAARPSDASLLPFAAVFRIHGALSAPQASLAPETLLTSAGALAGVAARVNPLGAIAVLAVGRATHGDAAPGCAAALERAESLPATPLAAIGGAALGAAGDALGAAAGAAGQAAGAVGGAVGGAAGAVGGAVSGAAGAVGGAVQGIGGGLRGLFRN